MNLSSTQISKVVLLVGAGNAHLQIIKWWAMNPLHGVEMTLVNDSFTALYSGMLPGFIAGQYKRENIEIDLVRLCAKANAKLIVGKANKIDRNAKQLLIDGRPPLVYDVLSLNVGSEPYVPIGLSKLKNVISPKPFHEFIRKIESFIGKTGGKKIVVIGGGASGVEIALSLKKRYSSEPNVEISLIQSDKDILPHYSRMAVYKVRGLFQKQGMNLLTSRRVVEGKENVLVLDNGELVEYDLCILATKATPPELLHGSDLTLDEFGFLRVNSSLQSMSDSNIFAVGDCIQFDNRMLPKAGVYAVREAPTLWSNLMASLGVGSFKSYQPQRRFLTILNTCDGEAILNYGRFSLKHRISFKIKNHIDQKWMDRFLSLYESKGLKLDRDNDDMRCGGCGAKVSSLVLNRVIKRLDVPKHPDVLVGCKEGEDASIVQPTGKLLVLSVDFFRTFLSDPFVFGQIAAQHSLNDLFAMGASPSSALAIVTIPHMNDHLTEDYLFNALSGALVAFKESGTILVGGHTSEGKEFAVGFSVTGLADKDSLFRKGALLSGEVLILTKPIGSGALLAAHMQANLNARYFVNLYQKLLVSNHRIPNILKRYSVKACTDVSGFGLIGHLLEMLDRSRVSATLFSNKIPLYEGFLDLTSKGIVSTLHSQNQKFSSRLIGEHKTFPFLFDPQTHGGLLFSIKKEMADEAINDLKGQGYVDAAIIGEVLSEFDKPKIQIL